jgi:hypothetical protein
MTAIMIIVVTVYGGGAAIRSVEYGSMATCQAAADKLKADTKGGYNPPLASCSPK